MTKIESNNSNLVNARAQFISKEEQAKDGFIMMREPKYTENRPNNKQRSVRFGNFDTGEVRIFAPAKNGRYMESVTTKINEDDIELLKNRQNSLIDSSTYNSLLEKHPIYLNYNTILTCEEYPLSEVEKDILNTLSIDSDYHNLDEISYEGEVINESLICINKKVAGSSP